MEFNEKLQELRKRKGLTQEELANSLYVSRTAVSKWESGKGYPNIESLKLIAKFFGVTIDELLSTNEVLTIAEEDGKEKENHMRDLIYGLFDISFIILLLFPLFAMKNGENIYSVSLISLDGVQPYLKVLYYIVIIVTVLTGILMLSLQKFQFDFWNKIKTKISLICSIISVILFIASLQPYVATYSFLILIIKFFSLKTR